MKSESTPILTYQTRIEVSAEADEALSSYATRLSRVTRSLYSVAMAGTDILSVKSTFLKRFEITARQFNACRVQLEGKISSVKECNDRRIADLKARIEKSEKKLARMGDHRRWRRKKWGLQQRQIRLRKKLQQLEEDRASGRVRICFGTRKLFHAQFNGEHSHKEWKREWNDRRNREFFVLGSKDETHGNQTCTATVAANGSLSLRLRLPNSCKDKYLDFHGLRFAYGHDRLIAALQECQLRADLKRANDPSYKDHGQAISFRFLEDEKGWRVYASTALAEPEWITDKRLGAIGLDINSDHLAIVETDRYGNPIASETIPCALYGKTQAQSKAIIGDACARAIAIAAKAKKPLVVEELDFQKKKRTLKEHRPSHARMLSSFAYSAILQGLRSRAYRTGVQLFSVNPAFTSLLGRTKFAARYGLTTHHAAALCIARRLYRFSSTLPSQSSVPDGRGGHIAFPVPVRNREKDEWSYLKQVARKLAAALAEHFRVARRQSSGSRDPCDVTSSRFVGATPTRESLATLLG